MADRRTPGPGEARLVVVGTGGRAYREYVLATLARQYRLVALLDEEPTWQRPYIEAAAVVDLYDADAIAAAVRSFATPRTEIGVLTWDEPRLEPTAIAAEQLGLPHLPAAAATACRDKWSTRRILAGTGISAESRLVRSEDEAVTAATAIGYPVVVKPRAMAGSAGVLLADSPEAVRDAFAVALSSRWGTLEAGHGVLVEEYLDGPELSVDSVVVDGQVECVHVAHKRLGFEPAFEEVGHLVAPWAREPWAQDVRDVVTSAHRALGVTYGLTHAEVRRTAAGWKLVELNGRLAGDLIPLVSRLATGVDLVVAAGDLAFGRRPHVTPDRDATAEVRFVYPPFDCTVRRVDVDGAAAVPGIAIAAAIAEPGARLLLPPATVIPRLASLIAVGDDADACARSLDRAEQAVVADIEPLDAAAPAPRPEPSVHREVATADEL